VVRYEIEGTPGNTASAWPRHTAQIFVTYSTEMSRTFFRVLFFLISCPASAQVPATVRPTRPNAPAKTEIVVRAVTQSRKARSGNSVRAEVETTEMLLRADEIDYDEESTTLKPAAMCVSITSKAESTSKRTKSNTTWLPRPDVITTFGDPLRRNSRPGPEF